MDDSGFHHCIRVFWWEDGFRATADSELALVNGDREGGEWAGELVETESGRCASDAGADNGGTRLIVLVLVRETRILDQRGVSGSHPRRRKTE